LSQAQSTSLHLRNHTDLPLILISGAPNSNDFASDRILHHTIGLLDRRQQINCFKARAVCRLIDLVSFSLIVDTTLSTDSPIHMTETQHVVAEVVEVRSPAQAARQIDHAIVTALTLKKPVYIEIACNIAEEPISLPVPFQLPPRKPSNSASMRMALDTTLEMWNAAAKPVIVIGVKVRDLDGWKDRGSH